MVLSDEKSGRRFLTIGVPVFSDPSVASSGLLGVVALRVKPETGLFRLLQEEAVPRTDETLLFRLDPTRPAYLSPLKDAPAGWAALNSLARSAPGSWPTRRPSAAARSEK